MSNLFKRFGWGMGGAIALLVGLWLILMVIAPNVVMVHFALKPNLFPSEIGGPKDVYTLRNFTDLFTDPVHRSIFFKTIRGSALVTLVTLVVTYPLAYWLAQVAKPRSARMMLIVLIIPFWINEVLRTLAWYIILALNGPLNVVLQTLGLMDQPVRWFGDVGVLAGMTYAYILFMLFPISNSIATLEHAQIDAARDLGASSLRIHRRVVIPHAKAGIATGCVFTFMLAAGSYVAPALLGSPGSRWFTEIIYNWFFEGGNWNKGAAYALVLLVLCMAVILLLLKLFRVNLTDVAK